MENKLVPLRVIEEPKVKFNSETGVKREFTNFWIRSDEDCSVGLYSNEYSGTKEEARSRAYLFAAAPELLQTLMAFEKIKDLWLIPIVDKEHEHEAVALHAARDQMLAVIKKAKGEIEDSAPKHP